ncbi:MAG: hypothetical protein KBS81_06215, partial [Spirochaetales bacterium]|nr:hypothetical protein [Candidatus Physcosoma equi]
LLMCSKRCPNLKVLFEKKLDISEDPNFKKCMRFSSGKLQKFFLNYAESIKHNIEVQEKSEELERKRKFAEAQRYQKKQEEEYKRYKEQERLRQKELIKQEFVASLSKKNIRELKKLYAHSYKGVSWEELSYTEDIFAKMLEDEFIKCDNQEDLKFIKDFYKELNIDPVWKNKVLEKVILIGEIGPAGGYVFYDKGYYSDGWRYLEAAPYDLENSFVFGYNRKDENSKNENELCTVYEIGSGKENTQTLFSIMGAYSFCEKKGPWKKRNAASSCLMSSTNGYTDWFLPSIRELKAMIVQLHEKGLGNFQEGIYWSSSELDKNKAWRISTDSVIELPELRGKEGLVRPCRAF